MPRVFDAEFKDPIPRLENCIEAAGKASRSGEAEAL
jgi:hypothetical protein